MSARSGRLGVGVIGAGRVGPVIGAALASAGHALVGVSAESDHSRDRVDAILPRVPTMAPPDIVERSELVVLAVPDDQLPGLVSGLAALGAWLPGQLVMHTSARFGISVLQPAVERGVIPLAVHPIMSFTGSSLDVSRLRESWCAVTAPAPVQPIGQALVVEMGAEPVIVEESDRAAFAEAIEIVTGFSTTVVGRATALAAGIGIDDPGRVLGPLVRSAVENALTAWGSAAETATIDSAADLSRRAEKE